MTSAQTIGLLRVDQAIMWRFRQVTAADLTPQGVFVLDADLSTDAPWLILDAGMQLHGLQVNDGGADATLDASGRGRLVVMSCASDAGAMLMGESSGPDHPNSTTSAAHRFDLTGAPAGVGSVGIDRRAIQFLYNPSAQRWWVPDWGAYSPARPADWTGTPPTSVASAVDRLAYAYALQHGTVPELP